MRSFPDILLGKKENETDAIRESNRAPQIPSITLFNQFRQAAELTWEKGFSGLYPFWGRGISCFNIPSQRSPLHFEKQYGRKIARLKSSPWHCGLSVQFNAE